MRARALCAALALNLWIAPAVAQSSAAEVDAPHLPPEAPSRSPIVEIPLPAEPPVVEKRAPNPVVVEKPKPPAPAAVQKAEPKPRGECVIKPVMSDDDLYNCGALR